MRRGLAVVCLLMVAVAVLAPLLAPFPEDAGAATHPERALLPPSLQHPFGTDAFGRDILSRVLYGFQVSPVIALAVLVIAVAIGLPLGLVAGYLGGVVDEAIMRVTDIFLAVPALLLALAFAVVLPRGLLGTSVAIAVSWWPWYARLVRGETASVAGRPHVEACRALGLSHVRIMLRHVLPHAVTPLVIQVSLDVGVVIVTASSLSFLGLGAQDPTPDWGLMVGDGKSYLLTQWWVATFPGLAIVLAAVPFNFIGDALRDRFDVRAVRP